jgi:hypothetical protein
MENQSQLQGVGGGPAVDAVPFELPMIVRHSCVAVAA